MDRDSGETLGLNVPGLAWNLLLPSYFLIPFFACLGMMTASLTYIHTDTGSNPELRTSVASSSVMEPGQSSTYSKKGAPFSPQHCSFVCAHPPSPPPKLQAGESSFTYKEFSPKIQGQKTLKKGGMTKQGKREREGAEGGQRWWRVQGAPRPLTQFPTRCSIRTWAGRSLLFSFCFVERTTRVKTSKGGPNLVSSYCVFSSFAIHRIKVV